MMSYVEPEHPYSLLLAVMPIVEPTAERPRIAIPHELLQPEAFHRHTGTAIQSSALAQEASQCDPTRVAHFDDCIVHWDRMLTEIEQITSTVVTEPLRVNSMNSQHRVVKRDAVRVGRRHHVEMGQTHRIVECAN